MTPSKGEIAARTRAAMAFAGIKKEPIGKLSAHSLARIIAEKREANLEERQEIADACGVPRLFMEVGFAPLQELTPSDERLAEVQQTVADLQRHLAEMERRITQPVTAAPPEPPAELRQKRKAPRSTAKTAPRKPRRPAAGSQ